MNLIYLKDGVVKLQKSDEFNTHLGMFKKGVSFGVSKSPFPLEYLPVLKRGPQVINLWDGMFMIGLSGIGNTSTVIEAGAGSGFLTVMIANVLSSGKLHAYEVRKDHYNIVKSNLELAGLQDRVVLHNCDVKSAKVAADAIFLDLPNPYDVIPTLKDNLIPGGSIVIYIPTVEQLKHTIESLKSEFTKPEVYTLEMKSWKVNPTRPRSKTLAHTGFIVYSRKLR